MERRRGLGKAMYHHGSMKNRSQKMVQVMFHLVEEDPSEKKTYRMLDH
jgi:hypothetical protein